MNRNKKSTGTTVSTGTERNTVAGAERIMRMGIYMGKRIKVRRIMG